MFRDTFTWRCTGRVARSALEATWLLRFSGAICPHAERPETCTPPGSVRPGRSLLLQARGEKPQPLRLIARLSPRFAAARTTGSQWFRAQTRHRAYVKSLDSDHVEASCESVMRFSTQSFDGPVRNFLLDDRAFVLPPRFEPRLARAATAATPSTASTHPAVRPRASSGSPVESAATRLHRGRSRPRSASSASSQRGNICERDMPPPARSQMTQLSFTPSGAAATGKSHPTCLGYPNPADAAVQPPDVMCFTAT